MQTNPSYTCSHQIRPVKQYYISVFKFSRPWLIALVIISLCLPISNLTAQDGKIIDQRAYTLTDSVIQRLERIAPNIRNTIATVDFFHITYLSDGLKVKGYLAVPKKAGKYPCIIYNRGGNRDFGSVTDEGFIARGLGELSAGGYVIAASQYRGNMGGEGKEEFGGKDVNDVLNMIPLFNKVPQADTSRIGMFGGSRGGMMTYLALTKTTVIKAAVVASGIADLHKLLESRPGFDTGVYMPLIPHYKENKLSLLKERSAIEFAEKINKTTPILVIQGTADWRVPTDQVLSLISKFYQLKQPFRFILYEGADHSLTEHRADYLQQIRNWFDDYLRDKKKLPDLTPHGD
jgi:dipeptidyl aminopeptidase/acylaminoacyl peptidase